MKIKKKKDLDARVARELGMDVKDVSEVTWAFFESVMEALSNEEEVHLAGFGRLRAVIEGRRGTRSVVHGSRGPGRMHHVRILRKFRVHFSKGSQFKRLLRSKFGPSVEKKS